MSFHSKILQQILAGCLPVLYDENIHHHALLRSQPISFGMFFRHCERQCPGMSHARRGMHTMFKLKRAYEPSAEDDGLRVLVDRRWPCNIYKRDARIDYWLKDIAPSTELMEWYHRDPA